MAQRNPILDDAELPEVDDPTWEEGRAMFDAEVQRLLGISGQEFLDRFDAGAYRGTEEDQVGQRINELIMLIPFARPTFIDDEGRYRRAD
ncbi:MAG: hypothetical protein H0U10_10190 [Chloroflexia bacterium]|nr:hypothetical protein [Chloroflexia bacterium]